MLEQLGPYNQTPEGNSLAMKLEPWPGGRWFRDLGNSTGHYWATVQAIKRPTLLKFTVPLFAFSPCVSNVQYRLTEEPGGTLITLRHTALGLLGVYAFTNQGPGRIPTDCGVQEAYGLGLSVDIVERQQFQL
jgi:hypothetical protein